MLDLIVVGGGYWGTATAALAKRHGLSVGHYDNAALLGASRAASAHFAFGWYKGKWAARAKRGYALATAMGLQFNWVGALVSTPKLRREGAQGVIRDDWAIFDPWDYLRLSAPKHAGVSSVGDNPTGIWVGGEHHPARGVVIAAGAWTDALLQRSSLPSLGVVGLRGTGVVIQAPHAPGDRVYVHGLNPFKQIAVRSWGHLKVRVGETSEIRPDVDYVAKMLKHVEYLNLPSPVETITGIRPMLPEPTVRTVANGVVVATGGGRIGAVLGFWAAEEALKMLRLV